jgi:hypothetical protein
MIWKFIILFFLLLFFWILFGPIIVKADTNLKNYGISLPGVFIAKLVPSDEGLFIIKGWILMIPFRFDPFKTGRKKSQKKDPSKKKLGNMWKGKGSIRRLRGIFRAIRIRKLEMDLDSDDFLLNAWLVPAFTMVNNNRNIYLRVNFEGRLYFSLDMRTRIGSMVWFFLTSK